MKPDLRSQDLGDYINDTNQIPFLPLTSDYNIKSRYQIFSKPNCPHVIL